MDRADEIAREVAAVLKPWANDKPMVEYHLAAALRDFAKEERRDNERLGCLESIVNESPPTRGCEVTLGFRRDGRLWISSDRCAYSGATIAEALDAAIAARIREDKEAQ